MYGFLYKWFKYRFYIRRVPVIPGSEYNFVYDISSHTLDDIENPKLGDRKQLLYDLAYAQWSVQEIEKGTAWEHLFNEHSRSNNS